MYFYVRIVGSIFVLLMTSCAADPPAGPAVLPQTTPSEFRVDAFVHELRGIGMTVEVTDRQTSQPFFTVPGRLIRVRGESVWAFEYPTLAAAGTDAALVYPDGSGIGTTVHIGWINTPHFYRRDYLIVLYVGVDRETMNGLERVLGPQFAGG